MIGFWRRRQRDAELDEEIGSHLRMAVEERVARGETRAAAEAAARREFGNVIEVKEVTREVWGSVWLDRLAQDVRYALRSLRRSPGFAAVAVLTLALGIGANTAVFTVVNSVLLRPLPFAEPNELVVVSHGPPPGPLTAGAGRFIVPGLMDRDYLAVQARNTVFARLATFSNRAVTLTGVGDPARLNAATVTNDFFNTLGVTPALGRGFTDGDASAERSEVVLLSDGLWHARFGADRGVLERTIVVDGVAKRVVGVMPPGFDFPNAAELWVPLEVRTSPGMIMSRPVVARLKDGTTREQARTAVASIMASADEKPPADFVAAVQPLKAFFVRHVQRSLLVFAGAVAFVLLIGCANVANLLLMRAMAREREITLRSALGAGRGRIIRQLLTESLVTALLGGAAGALLAYAGIRALLALAPAGRIPRLDGVAVDIVALTFTILVSALAGIIFGLVPALHAARGDVRGTLAASARVPSRGRARARSALVIAEIALALVLLTGAGLMLRTFRNMRAVELGFDPTNVLSMTVDLPSARYHTAREIHDVYARVLAGLSRIPDATAGLVNWRPFGLMVISGDFQAEGGAPLPPGYAANKMVVSAGYFRAMGIPLRRGREFHDSDDARSPGVVIVSHSVAERLWPNEDPIGKRISVVDNPKPTDWLTIVGVVDDVMQRVITGPRDAALYQPYTQVNGMHFLDHMTFVVRSAASPELLAAAMRDALHAGDPNLPVNSITSMDDVVASTTREPLFQAQLLTTFSLLALLLAAVGMYGVLAYAVTQRRAEIGIRMALGARATDVWVGVLAPTLVLTIVGVAIGAIGAFAVTRVLRTFLFGVTPSDPITFGAAALLLVLTAIFSAWLPATRAARVDPAAALRAE
jgi:predicted permease